MTFFKSLIFAMVASITMSFAGGDVASTEVCDVVAVDSLKESRNFYIGVNTALATGSVYDDLEWFDETTIGAQAGWVVYRDGSFSTALEGRYSTSADDRATDTYSLAGFVKPAYDFEAFEAYGLVGYGDYVLDGADLGDTDGLVYGAGLSVPFIYETDIFVDYVKYDETDDEVVAIGLNYSF